VSIRGTGLGPHRVLVAPLSMLLQIETVVKVQQEADGSLDELDLQDVGYWSTKWMDQCSYNTM
jgi:hypothetical protein